MGVLVIYNIQLSGEQLEVIGQGLDELKFKVASPVARVIQQQITAQEQAMLAAQAAKAKAEAEAEAKAAANAAPADEFEELTAPSGAERGDVA